MLAESRKWSLLREPAELSRMNRIIFFNFCGVIKPQDMILSVRRVVPMAVLLNDDHDGTQNSTNALKFSFQCICYIPFLEQKMILKL